MYVGASTWFLTYWFLTTEKTPARKFFVNLRYLNQNITRRPPVYSIIFYFTEIEFK